MAKSENFKNVGGEKKRGQRYQGVENLQKKGSEPSERKKIVVKTKRLGLRLGGGGKKREN